MNWVDVKKELPPNNSRCIVWVGNNEYFNCVEFNSKYFGVFDNRFVVYENGGEFEYDITELVTHWMIPINPNQK